MTARSSTLAPRRGTSSARRLGRPGLLAGLGVLLGLSLCLGVGIGAVGIAPPQAVAILLAHAGIDTGVGYSPQQDAVLWSIRLPRVVLGALVGAGLAISGAALQGLFRNPLADPGLVGVSSGAALGAVASIVVGGAALGSATVPGAAFAGGLAATVFVYLFARFRGRVEVVTLILTGLAVNALAGAGIGLFVFGADDDELRDLVFWQLGSLGGATWSLVGAAAPFIVAGLVLFPFLAPSLNLLSLGEREAWHLGVATERLRLILIGLTALTTGAAVAVSGIVGFVGLIVPHLVRLCAGPDHRTVLPASALGGASLLVLADLVARTVVSPAELPLGVVTALIGGPFFLWLLWSRRNTDGGWR